MDLALKKFVVLSYLVCGQDIHSLRMSLTYQSEGSDVIVMVGNKLFMLSSIKSVD